MKREELHKFIMERAVKVGNHFVNNPEATVRSTAAAFKMVVNTVHLDLTVNLKEADPHLHLMVENKLMINKRERYQRGGAATKDKWEKKKKVEFKNQSGMGMLCEYMSRSVE